MTVCTHGDFIVPPNWETRPPASMTWYFHPVTLSYQWANQSLPYRNYAKRLARTWQVSSFKSFISLDQEPWEMDGWSTHSANPSGLIRLCRFNRSVFGCGSVSEWLPSWPLGALLLIHSGVALKQSCRAINSNVVDDTHSLLKLHSLVEAYHFLNQCTYVVVYTDLCKATCCLVNKPTLCIYVRPLPTCM